MKLVYKGHLNTRNKFPKEFFQKFNDFPSDFGSLSILDELKNIGFGRMRRNP
jgi:hypothetical protein